MARPGKAKSANQMRATAALPPFPHSPQPASNANSKAARPNPHKPAPTKAQKMGRFAIDAVFSHGAGEGSPDVSKDQTSPKRGYVGNHNHH